MDLNYPPAPMIGVEVKANARIRNPDVRFYISERFEFSRLSYVNMQKS